MGTVTPRSLGGPCSLSGRTCRGLWPAVQRPRRTFVHSRVQVAKLGVLKGTAAWQPSPVMQLLLSNLLSTLSLSRTSIALRFTPLDGSGAWSIDDVYLDPRMK